MTRRPHRSHLNYNLFPYTTLFRANFVNPHIVFFVDDADAVELERLGPLIENDPLFPQRVNVNIASVKDGVIRLRVWERGVGLTRACGTGACATRSEEHTSELQSLMRISYAVFCLKTKNKVIHIKLY